MRIVRRVGLWTIGCASTEKVNYLPGIKMQQPAAWLQYNYFPSSLLQHLKNYSLYNQKTKNKKRHLFLSLFIVLFPISTIIIYPNFLKTKKTRDDKIRIKLLRGQSMAG